MINNELIKKEDIRNNIENDLDILKKANINILDVQHKLININEMIESEFLKDNMFFYTNGEAKISIENRSYIVDKFGVFHSSGNSRINIRPIDEWLEYYIIFYKVDESSYEEEDFINLLKKSNPFKYKYGYCPNNPLFINKQFNKIYESWIKGSSLAFFHCKVEFYSLVYYIYEELINDESSELKFDVVCMIKRYIEDYYSESISIQELSNSLGVSINQLNRLFKKELNVSPQEYIKQVRLNAVEKYLVESKYNLREISTATGFYDEFYMSKEFKKKYMVSPTEYRRNNTCRLNNLSMDNPNMVSYNEQRLVSLCEPKMGGDLYMFKQIKNKTFLAAALSLAILLTGCSTESTPKNLDEKEISVDKKEVVTIEDTRVVATSMGDVEIPADPKRIIVDYVTGDVMNLGVTPIGVRSIYTGSALDDEIDDIKMIEQWDPEEIMSLEPDLIISVVKEEYETLSKIAPTIYVPFTELSMEDRVMLVGEVLNKTEEAEVAIKDYYKKVEEAKAILKDKDIMDKTISIFFGNPADPWVAGDKWGRGGDIIYNDLGFRAPEPIQNEIIGNEQYRGVSLELLPDYVGDYLIFDWDEELFEKGSLWEMIPAYKDGKMIPLDFAFFYYNDLYSQTKQLDFIVDSLLKLENK